MQVNTEGGLQKKSRMYYTVEMALDRGVISPPDCTDLTQQLSLFVIFNPLL